MSSAPAGHGPHPGDERLAALLVEPEAPGAGEVGAEIASTRAHLLGCDHCAGRLATLTQIGARLAALPAPAMPADVVAGVDAALAAARRDLPAAGGDTPTTRPPAGAHSRPGRVPRATAGDRRGDRPPHRRRPTRPNRRALLGVGGAIVVLLAVAGVGHEVRDSSGSGSSSTTAGVAAAAPSGADGAAPAAPGPAAGSAGGPVLTTAGVPVTDSGVDYHHATLAGGVSLILAATATRSGGGSTSTTPSVGTRSAGTAPAPTGSAAAVPAGCLAALVAQVRGASAVPVLVGVDIDRYDEQPALLIVLDGVPAQGSATGYSVSSACTTGAAHILDHAVVTS